MDWFHGARTSRDRSSVVVDCPKISDPASNDVLDAVGADAFALLSTPKPNELRPYTVPRSHCHDASWPRNPAEPDASVIFDLMNGRKPSGNSARTVRSSFGRRHIPADAPRRWPYPPNAYSSTPFANVCPAFATTSTSRLYESPCQKCIAGGRSLRGSPAKY